MNFAYHSNKTFRIKDMFYTIGTTCAPEHILLLPTIEIFTDEPGIYISFLIWNIHLQWQTREEKERLDAYWAEFKQKYKC